MDYSTPSNGAIALCCIFKEDVVVLILKNAFLSVCWQKHDVSLAISPRLSLLFLDYGDAKEEKFL